jgi:hypothetical protein
MVEGDIDAHSSSFEITTETSGDLDNPLSGPFIIRGKNIHYVDSLSALSVDFTVEHQCACTFDEPVGMTFVRLLPPGVTVQNPDNDEHGDGASIVFGFANDDGVWTSGEESFPRTVLFGVAPGVSIGFLARIDVNQHPQLGSVGGVVWNDHDEDGVMDREEPGIGGVVINMYRTDGPERSMQPEILWRTVTARDGSYRFDGLDAGHYEVKKLPRDDLRPTTPELMQVILVERDGQVSNFLMANFGCVPSSGPPPIIDVGDFVDVWGGYVVRPGDHVVSRTIHLTRCENARPLQSGFVTELAAQDTSVIDVCDLTIGALTGPVTDKQQDARRNMLWIMGTPIQIGGPAPPEGGDVSAQPPGTEIDFEDVEIGDVVTVFASPVPGQNLLYGVKIYLQDIETFAHEVQVHGKVDEILMTSTGLVGGFISMRTKVLITDNTEIRVFE